MSQGKTGTLCKAQTWNIIPNSRVETKTENLMETHKSLLIKIAFLMLCGMIYFSCGWVFPHLSFSWYNNGSLSYDHTWKRVPTKCKNDTLFFKDGDSHSYKAGHMVIPMELICGSSPASPSPPLGTPEQRMCFVSTSKFI